VFDANFSRRDLLVEERCEGNVNRFLVAEGLAVGSDHRGAVRQTSREERAAITRSRKAARRCARALGKLWRLYRSRRWEPALVRLLIDVLFVTDLLLVVWYLATSVLSHMDS
jgi:hypothetical protein